MRRTLALILVCFAALGVVYSVVVPLFEASDELWHYPMVKTIADHWELPVQDAVNVGPWRQEGSQPPLYYGLAAVLTFWIDTSDMDVVRRLNPHVDSGVSTPDGNINMVVHHPVREAFPWQGTALAVHLIRLLSVGMGVATVYLTYRLVSELFPERPELALGVAAVNAFTPMFVFVSGSVNNDSLAILLCTLALFLIAKTGNLGPEAYKTGLGTLAVGVVLGLAALAKESALGLLPLTLLAVSVRSWYARSEESVLRRLGLVLYHLLLVVLPASVIAGWWYWRNWRLHGDPLGWNLFLDIVGRRTVPANLAQLWSERHSFLAGYWGDFGGFNVPMPAWAYGVLNALALVAGLGLVVTLIRLLVRKAGIGPWRLSISALWSSVVGHLQLVVVLLWPIVVLGSWIRWTRLTPASQGRLVFPAIPVWSLLLALGLAAWLPRRWGRWAVAAFAVFLLGLAVAAPLAWIRPAYALPERLTDAEVAAIPEPMEVDFEGVMRLLGYELEAEAVEAGGQLGVTLYWEAIAPAERDYTVFVHLLAAGELVVAQRDTYPGLGKLSTTWLEPGFRWADRYVVQVPDTAYAPDVVEVEIGLYDRATGARLPLAGVGGTSLGDNLRFGRVEVLARPGEVPNPISVSFGERMALVGYDLDRRVVRPGESLTVTLYWQGLRTMETNYTVSVQLVDELQRKAAQEDSWPRGGAAPTASWESGETIVDGWTLKVYDDATAGVYDVRVVVYVLQEGEIVRLPVIPEGGRMLTDHVVLTRVRVR